ncbi:MAG TPA: MMPL family transporter [Paludibacteraceae bacterium]|nr:MMPL family transporter [Paludibacteraceae bacterium]HQF49689.1 MMPL family transporter [Paludibacteraceae bacterium]
MTNLAILIYNFFKEHKILFYAILICSSIFFVYTGLKVEYEEDISKLLPTNKNGSEKLVFNNLKVKDKLFILFSPTSDTVSKENLMSFCDEFIDSLLAKDTAHTVIYDALYRIDDEVITNAIATLSDNLPIFMDSTDYPMMDSLLSEKCVDSQMQENLMMLSSPAGMAFTDMIGKDPAAFRKIFMNKMNLFGDDEGSSFIIIDKHFFAPDSTFELAFISPNFQSFDSKLGIQLIELLESNMQSFSKTHPKITVHFHGAPVQSVFNSRQIKKDLSLTMTISLSLICIIILLCYKNKSTLLYMLLPVIYGTFFSLSIVYCIKGGMSLLAIAIGAIVLGVALSYCLHIITHFKYISDPIKVLKDQCVPVCLGFLTTIGAFIALLFTQSELLKDFGIFASLALVGTTLFSLLFLPQFINPKKNKKSNIAFSLLERFNSYPFEKNTILIISIVVISCICIVTSRWVKFDADLVHIGYYEPRVVESLKMMDSQIEPGFDSQYYATSSKNLDSALIYNQQLHEMLDSMKGKGNIRSYSKATSLFIPTQQQQQRINYWNNYWTDAKKKEIKNRIITYGNKYGFNEEMFASFFDKIDKKYEPISLYDSGILPSNILCNLIEYTDSSYLVFTPVFMKKNELSAISKQLVASNENVVVIDPFFYTNSMVEIINNDFNVTLGISSLFVFIVLLFSFKSIILSILAFIPMALSWYIVQGAMAIFGLPFNLINIVISTFIFGIGVDYSIFIMVGLLADFRTRRKLLTYHKTAIVFSAVVLIIGIASLLFATHPAMASIGISTLIGMNTVVLLSYSLQPFLFYWLIIRPTKKGQAPVTLYNLIHATSYFGKEKFTDAQKIINNYEYKGDEVEHEIRHDLGLTRKFSIISKRAEEAENVFDFGCGYGFISYWFSIKNKKCKITGYEPDPQKLALAENCYLKNESITFSSDKVCMNGTYDVCIVNRTPNADELPLLRRCVEQSKLVIVRKLASVDEMLVGNFVVADSDFEFVIYSKSEEK